MKALAGYTLASGDFYPLEDRGRPIKVQISQWQDPFEIQALRHYHTRQPGTNRILWTSCEAISVSPGISLELVFFYCCAKAFFQTGLLPRCNVLLNAFGIISELRCYVSTVNENQPRPSSLPNSQIPWMLLM